MSWNVRQAPNSKRYVCFVKPNANHITQTLLIPNQLFWHLYNFWPCNVVKRGICYENVCPSVCHTCESRLNGSRYRIMRRTTPQNDAIVSCTISRNPKFKGSSQMTVSKRHAPCRQEKFDKYSAISWKECEIGNRGN